MLHITLEKLANAHCTSTVYTLCVHTHCTPLTPTCLLHAVLIEAMCAEIFPHKTTTTVCLGFCFHTSSMIRSVSCTGVGQYKSK